jgi:hypothetical protein
MSSVSGLVLCRGGLATGPITRPGVLPTVHTAQHSERILSGQKTEHLVPVGRRGRSNLTSHIARNCVRVVQAASFYNSF